MYISVEDLISDVMVGKCHDIEKVMDRMRRLCSRREYCSADILKKAADALDGDDAKASEVLGRLVEEKYVDGKGNVKLVAYSEENIDQQDVVNTEITLVKKMKGEA